MSCINLNAVSYLDSNWVPAWIPIKYSFSNNKWPANTFDTTDTVSTIVDANGYAKVTLSSTSETYVEKEYIKISGSNVESYDGVWQILQLHSSTQFTISANYNGVDSLNSFQRYYNNYHIKLRVYAGIRANHSQYVDNPMALRGTEKSLPDASNLSEFDISSYIRKQLSPIKNDLCTALSGSNGWMGNDTNMWTSFYVSYAESYDVVTSGEITTFTSTYQDDMLDSYDVNLLYASNSAVPFQYFQGKSIGQYAIYDSTPDVEADFLTLLDIPTYYRGNEFDISIIIAYTDERLIDEGVFLEYVITEYDVNGAVLNTETASIDREDEGVYRFALSEYPLSSSTTKIELYIQKDTGTKLSETKTVNVATSCGHPYLRWLNQPGGWEGREFTARFQDGIDVKERKIVRRDIYANFDTDFVYGSTQDDYYDTEAYETKYVSTDWLTENECEDLEKWLRVSNKVLEIFSSGESGCTRFKQRTVLIDKASFYYKSNLNKQYQLNFTYRYTDQMIIQGQ